MATFSIRGLSSTTASTLFYLGLLVAAIAQGGNFQDKDLTERDLSGQALDGADFTGATLRGTRFWQASLRGAIFKDADLRNARFDKADLTGADFTGATFGLNGLDNANFTRANLGGVDLKGQSGFRVTFRNATLTATRGWNICSSCDFRGADLRGANLLGLMQHPETIFTGATYDNGTRWPRWFDAERAGVKRQD